MEEKEIHKIKRHHLMLVILFIVLLCVPFIIFKCKIMIKDNQIKDDAITFLKENISEIQPICDEVIENKSSQCQEWEYYDICYNDNSALMDERGLTTRKWKLKYSNNNWYVIIKGSSDKTINITNNVK